jgi:hypothetical protein
VKPFCLNSLLTLFYLLFCATEFNKFCIVYYYNIINKCTANLKKYYLKTSALQFQEAPIIMLLRMYYYYYYSNINEPGLNSLIP